MVYPSRVSEAAVDGADGGAIVIDGDFYLWIQTMFAAGWLDS